MAKSNIIWYVVDENVMTINKITYQGWTPNLVQNQHEIKR